MKRLADALSQLNIKYSDAMLSTFEKYMEGILDWNTKINLTSITLRDEFIDKHYIDSLLCYGFQELNEANTIIDIGTGAGFPGIPLAIVCPNKEFVLMDSLKKRLKVIDELCTNLGIRNVKTLHGRAEDLARDQMHRERYDLCVARAVANLPVLCEYTLPFIRVGGCVLAYKGSEIQDELKAAQKAIHLLGGALTAERQVKLQNLNLDHRILVINKIKTTPSLYPRRAGTPSKEPLK